jgi:dopamine beta-monooxygenase
LFSEQPRHAVNEVYDCNLAFDPACTDLLSVWLLGIPGECMHEKMGFRIGKYGYKRGGIQV